MATVSLNKLRRHADVAQAIAHDGCHKIYLAMDAPQVARFAELNYGENNSELVRRDGHTLSGAALTDHFVSVLLRWWTQSCELRFIQTVSTNDRGEAVYDSVVLQLVDTLEGAK